jgi:hypothetical protein
MPASIGRSAVGLAVPVLLVVLVSGCAGQPDESTAAGQATTSTTVTSTTTVPRLTAQELAWLVWSEVDSCEDDGICERHAELHS